MKKSGQKRNIFAILLDKALYGFLTAFFIAFVIVATAAVVDVSSIMSNKPQGFYAIKNDGSRINANDLGCKYVKNKMFKIWDTYCFTKQPVDNKSNVPQLSVASSNGMGKQSYIVLSAGYIPGIKPDSDYAVCVSDSAESECKKQVLVKSNASGALMFSRAANGSVAELPDMIDRLKDINDIGVTAAPAESPVTTGSIAYTGCNLENTTKFSNKYLNEKICSNAKTSNTHALAIPVESHKSLKDVTADDTLETTHVSIREATNENNVLSIGKEIAGEDVRLQKAIAVHGYETQSKHTRRYLIIGVFIIFAVIIPVFSTIKEAINDRKRN